MVLILIYLAASVFFVFALLAAISETVNGGKDRIFYAVIASISLFVLALFTGRGY